MLKNMGEEDYHRFRLPYWDWRSEIQNSFGIKSEDLFTADRLGETRFVDGFPQVFGSLYNGSWDTICWQQLGVICDPGVSTGPLQRCPIADACLSTNPDWPTLKDVNDGIAIEEYDAPPYDILSEDGFRNYMDFDVGSDIDECREDGMCQCVVGGIECSMGPSATITEHMHFLVSASLLLLI